MSEEGSSQAKVAAGQAAPRPTAKPVRWYTKAVYGVASIVFIIVTVAKVYDFFFPSLPSCDGKVARETISQILEREKLAAASYDQMRMLSKSEHELRCGARLKMSDGALMAITYRIFWKGKEAFVEITQRGFNKDDK